MNGKGGGMGKRTENEQKGDEESGYEGSVRRYEDIRDRRRRRGTYKQRRERRREGERHR